jgi:drug/metabolite transporter (DMT)-like permease
VPHRLPFVSDAPPSGDAWFGPVLVAAGAFLWATDSIWRSQVVGHYPATFIVFFNHLICLTITLPLLLRRWRVLGTLRAQDWAALLYIAVCGSALAMVLFTRAFAATSNYTIPILIQKLQPVFAILLARWLLKERLGPRFGLWATLAAVGAYLVSFGATNAFTALSQAELEPVLNALAAAVIWGGTTVAGRHLLGRVDGPFVTAARFSLASVALLVLVVAQDGLAPMTTAWGRDFRPFAMMALFSGMLPLLIYYIGLKRTRASVASLAELAFPVGAIAINWLVLATPMSAAQLAGAALLLTAVTALSLGQRTRPSSDRTRSFP